MMFQKQTVFIVLFFSFLIYSVFVYTIGTNTVSVTMNENAIMGKLIYQKHNCTACHQIYGLGGYLGPELTTMISEPAKGEMFAKAILKSGSQRMPDFKLNDHEIKELIEYFKYVDETAVTYKKSK